MTEILNVLLDSLLDSLKLLLFLFAAYLLIEYFEHKASDKMIGTLSKFGRLSPVLGAAMGIVPQCGFSVSASYLYAGKIISLGTLTAVFISTSDEAIPVLIAYPEMYGYLWKLVAVKLIAAVIFGFLIDALFKFHTSEPEIDHAHHDMHSHCEKDCCEHGFFHSVIKHTLTSYLFILAFLIIINLAVYFIGEDRVSSLIPDNAFLQPLICAMIGFIPNCASSLLLTELFVKGAISFGALCAGLITNAGVGLAAMFRAVKDKKYFFIELAALLVCGVITGYVVSLFIK